MNGEFLLLCLSIEGFLVESDFVSIDQMLFKFVEKDSFNWVDFHDSAIKAIAWLLVFPMG